MPLEDTVFSLYTVYISSIIQFNLALLESKPNLQNVEIYLIHLVLVVARDSAQSHLFSLCKYIGHYQLRVHLTNSSVQLIPADYNGYSIERECRQKYGCQSQAVAEVWLPVPSMVARPKYGCQSQANSCARLFL